MIPLSGHFVSLAAEIYAPLNSHHMLIELVHLAQLAQPVAVVLQLGADEIATLTTTIGVPAAVAFLLLRMMDSTLKETTDSVEELDDEIHRLRETMHAEILSRSSNNQIDSEKIEELLEDDDRRR